MGGDVRRPPPGGQRGRPQHAGTWPPRPPAGLRCGCAQPSGGGPAPDAHGHGGQSAPVPTRREGPSPERPACVVLSVAQSHGTARWARPGFLPPRTTFWGQAAGPVPGRGHHLDPLHCVSVQACPGFREYAHCGVWGEDTYEQHEHTLEESRQEAWKGRWPFPSLRLGLCRGPRDARPKRPGLTCPGTEGRPPREPGVGIRNKVGGGSAVCTARSAQQAGQLLGISQPLPLSPRQ